MKKLILAAAVLVGMAGAASAQWNDETPRPRYEQRGWFGGGSWRAAHELDHLNRMLSHVRWEVRQYGAGWRTRSELNSLTARVADVNARYRSGRVDPRWLRGRIEYLHNELHGIEIRLHARPQHFYRWQ